MKDDRGRFLATLLIVAGGLILIGAGLTYYLINRPVKSTFPQVGTQMSGFALSDLQGRTVHLSDYKGETVLINSWATWCPPCRDEMPILVDYYNRTRPDGIVILGINAGESRDEAAAFAQEFGMKFPILLDTNSNFLDSIRIDSLPTTILVGPDGNVRALHVGLMTEEIFNNEIVSKIK